jgi:WD40 repeat protein
VITGSNDGTARLWDQTTGQPVRVLQVHTGGVSAVAVAPDGTRVITVVTTRLRECGTGPPGTWCMFWKAPLIVSGRWRSPRVAAAVTGGDDHTVQVWNCTTGQQIKVLHDHTGPVVSLTSR